ncbi:phytanoyl-CoA dioxygenase family protein [Hymenobacter bucti]|uniref:Phytanoyl-CoA dioxygenase family protein n=1 Tax=Hymenobacter bucti TaxID=1844114 RepID=A0ABW4QQB9_9BACT
MKALAQYTGFLRRLRFTYWLFNLANLLRLTKNKELYKSLGIGRAVWQHVAHADIKQPSADIPWLDQAGVTPAAIRQRAHFASFPAAVQEQLLQWPAQGFIILPGLLTAEADAVNAEITALRQAGKIDFNFTGRKIFNAWQHSPAVAGVFHHPLLLRIIRFIFEKDVIPFQTVNFVRGSQEKPHSDSIHMTTEPLGYLAAVWVALEDIQVGSGELLFYPGSHKLHYVMSEDFASGNTALHLGTHTRESYETKIEEVIQQHACVGQPFLAKKGDVLLWHANLLHAGSPISDPQLTRHSMVAHYFADGVLRYHEITQRPAII